MKKILDLNSSQRDFLSVGVESPKIVRQVSSENWFCSEGYLSEVVKKN